MNRRTFLHLSALIPLYNIKLEALEKLPKEWYVIYEVYDVLFPQTTTMPKASKFEATQYLINNIYHETFPKDDREFILQGAKDFKGAFPKFLNSDNKEQFIIKAQKNSYGNDWLTKLLEYGFEAMFSDPIYGGNKNEAIWKAVNHKAGLPRPKIKYGARI